MTDDSSFPWVEEFRPNKVEDVIGAEHLVGKMNEYISGKSIPHLLFCGGPGTGKTTVAKILANNISGKNQYLYINASDRNNIETIRTDVVNYCGTTGFDDNVKILILDEADGLTPQAQMALRPVMETYAKNCRFILTCNYGTKIIKALRSRCQEFTFEGASPTQIAKKCVEILKAKKVPVDESAVNDIKSIVKSSYPDIRSIINKLQQFTNGTSFKYIDVKTDMKKELIKLLKEGKIKDIRENILSTTVDYLSLYDAIFRSAKELSNDVDKISGIMIHTADYMYKHNTHPDAEINFVAYMLEIANTLKG